MVELSGQLHTGLLRICPFVTWSPYSQAEGRYCGSGVSFPHNYMLPCCSVCALGSSVYSAVQNLEEMLCHAAHLRGVGGGGL